MLFEDDMNNDYKNVLLKIKIWFISVIILNAKTNSTNNQVSKKSFFYISWLSD